MNIIEVHNLTKKFKELIAVNNISFSVKEGEIFAFLGLNGAGKTTTIKMLTTLLHQTSGEIMIHGYNPLHDKNNVRKSFGIVFQDPSLDDELSAFENLEFHGALYAVPKKLRKERINYLLKLVELWDRQNDLVKTFSGGMKRRLEIARGLIHHPKILFLDEPTLGLDVQTRKQLWEHITHLNKEEKMTVFLTTHYMEEAEKIAHSIAIIDKGRILQHGTAVKLKEFTKTASLEEAFLKLTGHEIREEKSTAQERMRQQRKVWTK